MSVIARSPQATRQSLNVIPERLSASGGASGIHDRSHLKIRWGRGSYETNNSVILSRAKDLSRMRATIKTPVLYFCLAMIYFQLQFIA